MLNIAVFARRAGACAACRHVQPRATFLALPPPRRHVARPNPFPSSPSPSPFPPPDPAFQSRAGGTAAGLGPRHRPHHTRRGAGGAAAAMRVSRHMHQLPPCTHPYELHVHSMPITALARGPQGPPLGGVAHELRALCCSTTLIMTMLGNRIELYRRPPRSPLAGGAPARHSTSRPSLAASTAASATCATCPSAACAAARTRAWWSWGRRTVWCAA